jgi:hypothetical protein
MVTITTPVSRSILAVFALVLTAIFTAPIPAYAQSGDAKPTEQKAPNDKRESVKIEENAEVGRLLSGPASNPECFWLGRRVLNRLWVDDLDTAFRHLDLYDRFGCPGGHIQATFRCLVRQGDTDPKAPDVLNTRIKGCWISPSQQAPSTTAQSPESGSGSAGTTTR